MGRRNSQAVAAWKPQSGSTADFRATYAFNGGSQGIRRRIVGLGQARRVVGARKPGQGGRVYSQNRALPADRGRPSAPGLVPESDLRSGNAHRVFRQNLARRTRGGGSPAMG